ncbi:tyrosine-type recombinase/integrase [Salipiger sp. P9]|nr:integrase arm-type DNA-binding domain-containing protein [Salipiger pentaromativorans]MCR8551205.1 tyrosine-type recombinase/integrase [Salipiger pentaromativorans]
MKAKSLAAGKYADGQGLWLIKRSQQAGKWVLRLSVAGKRREMGLGPWPEVSLADARMKALQARATLRDGLDPVAVRQKERLSAKRLTVKEAVEGCFKARKAELKADGTAGRWMSPLALHVLPKIGALPVEDVDQHVLKRTLEPIWHKKADTARKAMNRLGLTLKHAAALGLDVDLQATMKAQALLGKQRHITKHVPSLPYQEAPAFYQWLCTQPHQSCFVLRLLLLTAARTGEVRFATTEEIIDDMLVIPPERTKTKREHKIPLTDEALRVIKQAQKFEGTNLLFPSSRGKPLSDATMSRFMEREGYEARPHGFRATFRSWAEECTDAPFEVKEACLGHAVDKGVVGAYQRGERLERRLKLLKSWQEHLLVSQ